MIFHSPGTMEVIPGVLRAIILCKAQIWLLLTDCPLGSIARMVLEPPDSCLWSYARQPDSDWPDADWLAASWPAAAWHDVVMAAGLDLILLSVPVPDALARTCQIYCRAWHYLIHCSVLLSGSGMAGSLVQAAVCSLM